MTQYLDFYNLMAYDFSGSFSKQTGHSSNLAPSKKNPKATDFSTTAAIDYYTQNGAPAEKIVLGMPLYGHGFAETDGLGSSFNGGGEGSWEKGIWDYKVLPQEGAKEELDSYYDGGCGASWSWDANKRMLISYDTQAMTEEKTRFIKEKGLGGAMWWESSGDRGGKGAEKKDGSLMGTFVEAVGTDKLEKVENVLSYPESQYDNVKKGFSQ